MKLSSAGLPSVDSVVRDLRVKRNHMKGGAQVSNPASLAGAQTDLYVEEGIVLKSVGLAGAAAASAIGRDARSGALLMAGGMTGLFVLARKREN